MKGTDQTTDKRVERIVKEMINVETGITYFDIDGVRMPKSKPGHNTYIIDSVSYEVHPNIGVVYVFQGTNSDIMLKMIQSKVLELKNAYFRETGIGMTACSGIAPTTQYICITDSSNSAPTQKISYLRTTISTQPRSDVFTWYIYTNTQYMHNSPLYVPEFNSANVTQEKQLLSLSTIIMDLVNAMTLEDNYRSPDLPPIESYTQYARGFLSKLPIHINMYYGIHWELARNFNPALTKMNWVSSINQNVYWLKWEDVNPNYTVNCNVKWNDQVKNQAMKPYDKAISRKNACNVDHRCIMTGIPIYEDCYVFDIYSQTVTKTIPVDELDAAIANGACLHTPSTSSRRKKPLKKNAPKTVDINCTIKHKKPLRVLVSPYAVHLCKYQHNCITTFELLTNSSVIVYRSFCPRLCIDIIDNLNGSDAYKAILSAINISFKIDPVNYTKQLNFLINNINGVKVKLDRYFHISELISGKSVTQYTGVREL